MKHPILIACGLVLVFLTNACGYSEKEWQAQLDKYGKLNDKYEEESEAHQKTAAQLAAMEKKVLRAKNELEQMGVNLDQLHSQLQERGTEKERLAQSLEE
ncbi:MAG: hypothetical protein MK135_09540, partial [Polyangiaceae bacterium]|nr:hypothetical protein [Polyangiaceae bacterium]